MSEMGKEGGQQVDFPLSKEERDFMIKIAIPHLNTVTERFILEHLAASFWNLCQWEADRTKSIDSKALSLLGFASIAAALVAVAATPGPRPPTLVLCARCLSLGLFAATVAVCLWCARGRRHGAFLDSDVFRSLCAHEATLGDLPPFADRDQTLCYLRETVLQRWLVYRGYSDMNDHRFRILLIAQVVALISVISLVLYVAVFLLS